MCVLHCACQREMHKKRKRTPNHMREIELIERMLGQEFGREPKIVENTVLNRVKELHRAGADITDLLAFIFPWQKTWAAAYLPETHTVLAPPGEIAQHSLEESYLIHELTHAYINQRNGVFFEAAETILKVMDKGLETVQQGDLERAVVIHAIHEGIADYVPILCQRLQLDEDYDRPWNQLRDLSPIVASYFPENWEWHLDEMLTLSTMNQRDKILQYSWVKKHFAHFSSSLGHYLVRLECDSASEDMASAIDRLIMSPPEEWHDVDSACDYIINKLGSPLS